MDVGVLERAAPRGRVTVELPAISKLLRLQVVNEKGDPGRIDLVEHGIVRGVQTPGPVGGAAMVFTDRK